MKLSFAFLSKSHSNPRFLDFISILTRSFPVLGRAKEDEVDTAHLLTLVWDKKLVASRILSSGDLCILEC